MLENFRKHVYEYGYSWFSSGTAGMLSNLPPAPEAASASAEEKNGIVYLLATNKVSHPTVCTRRFPAAVVYKYL